MISNILAIISALIFFVADRFTKAYIESNYALHETSEFIPGLIDLVYIHNQGGAWGMLSGRTWLLVLVTVIVMCVCVVMLIRYGRRERLIFWAICLVLSGGVGNMIDRIFNNGNVIDFLHFEFWPDFPVFNVADCSIVIGAGLLILYFIIGIKKDADKVRQSKKSETDEEKGIDD